MKFKYNYAVLFTFGLIGALAHAQIPTEVPKPQDNPPVDFSDPANMILFIILPLIVILLFFIWRSKQRKDKVE